MDNTENLINYLGQLKFKVNSDFMSEPIDEVINQLERFEEFKKEVVWCEDDKYGHPVYNRATIGYLYKQKYSPCSKIKQLEQFKAEFVKSEHSYYMERFMETCIKLFKEKK